MLSVCYIVSPSIVLLICGPKVYNRLPLSELLAVLDTYTYSETSFGPVDVRLNRFFKLNFTHDLCQLRNYIKL